MDSQQSSFKDFYIQLAGRLPSIHTYVFCTLKRLKKSSQYAAGEADSTFFFNPNTTLIFWWMIFCGCAMLGQLFQEKNPMGYIYSPIQIIKSMKERASNYTNDKIFVNIL